MIPVGSRYALTLFCALLLLAGLMLFSIAAGSTAIPLSQVLAALGLSSGEVSPMISRIILELRVPRSLLAALTGAGLAMVGAFLQTVSRNDLADPFLFGLSAGASAGAVAVITRFGERLGDWALPTAAFSGGILSAIAVIALFLLQQARGAERLIICGLAISFLFGALTNYLVFSGDQRAASSILFWSLGGLGLARWDNLPFALVSVLLLFALTILRWRSLDGLLAGGQTAASLGINTARLRIEVFICCAFATSLLVALTGVIGFVGLMVPHLARPLSGVLHRRLLPLTAILGAMLMCGGDVLSRRLLAPQELPIGIITAGLGGVFVLGLLLKRQ
ncbi:MULTISPECIES: iron ABC transporter permease [unclassified Brenneria]|uniref:FecCD family ABC transporter permease n=1 Tax=unclassified Brenneria TaxID=2634434 RepID=UPI0029C48F28|nr:MULTISPECIES: iron ABC transporter permease [unclassified Brenneria]MDX5630421.1 iron ABC transporter permease [Brenneria sp. L3-3Z]MDX5697566.1 iron ABC transporter permease [Brenneria sp. L4-2C]MEE3664305.1 iron ABC transporter permease [Brenneria sp. g21c3]